MGLKFLKRKSPRKQGTAAAASGGTATKENNSKRGEVVDSHSQHSRSHCDASTDSDRSGTSSKSGLAESYCRTGKWDSVLKVVSQSTVDDWNPSPSEDGSHCLHQVSSPLHLILAHGAPLKVVESMIDLMTNKFEIPVPEESLDEFGRTPLHVAVQAGCDEETVHRLLNGHGLVMPAVIQDENQQTPLHLACATSIVKKQKKKSVFAPNPTAMLKWHKRQVMLALMYEYPEACSVKDKYGKTPLDYAREQGLKDSSVNELERLSREYAVETPETACAPSQAEIAANMSMADIPFIVPSLSGSCRDFHRCSILNLEDLDHQDLPDASDVSTIGDNEAVLDDSDFLFFFP
jgi:hypothetical protein